jgi:hypothetical protein
MLFSAAILTSGLAAERTSVHSRAGIPSYNSPSKSHLNQSSH